MTINNSTEFLKELKKRPENFYIVHYSCQNFNDDNEGLSPRITSIAISHYSTEQSVSFSTHAVAEELGIARAEVKEKQDEIEKELLRQYFQFVRDRRASIWVHWNMRNAIYGFEHLEHRYKVLGGTDASVVPVEQRVNLNDMLKSRYGSGYAPHQYLPNLMEMNGGRHRDFLSGQEEVAAFENSEFMKMHKSTLCKVGFFHFVIRKMLAGKLRTQSRGFGAKIDKALEGRLAKGGSLGASTLGIVYALTDFVPWLVALF